MNRPFSLRTSLLIGLVLLNVAVIAGFSTTVYARADSQAHEALHAKLRVHAKTFAGAFEFEGDAPELEFSPRLMPEFVNHGSGAYAGIYNPDGTPIIRCQSLYPRQLESSAPWGNGEFAFHELAKGPDDIPCTVVTYSFLARVDGDDEEDQDDHEGGVVAGVEDEPTGRACQVRVALDSRPRDAGLAQLLWFLVLIGGGSLVATTIGGLLVARYVLKPVHTMTAEAAALTPEDTSRRLRPESGPRELRSLAGTLNSALDRLGSAFDRQKRFTSDASHELRTPLSVLLGNAELLLRKERTGKEYRRGLERQRRIATRMTEITENLLALARSDGGAAEIEHDAVELPQLARSVVNELEPIAAAGEISLECRADGEITVDGDATHLSGLLENLVSNAVKFTPRGGAVQVTVSRNGKYAIVDVSDSGPGIPDEHREHVFDRFFRVHDGRDRREGAGLGLAIVEWIVQAHEGHIDVRNRPGGGATFTVKLPLHTAVAA